MTLFSDDRSLAEPSGWIIFGVLGTFFGLVVGHSWFRET
jgi:hypothetical protein